MANYLKFPLKYLKIQLTITCKDDYWVFLCYVQVFVARKRLIAQVD